MLNCFLLWEFQPQNSLSDGKTTLWVIPLSCCHAHHHGRRGYTEVLIRPEEAQPCCCNSACVCVCVLGMCHLSHSYVPSACDHFSCCRRHAKHVLRLAALHHMSKTCLHFAHFHQCKQVQSSSAGPHPLSQIPATAAEPTSSIENNSFIFSDILSLKEEWREERGGGGTVFAEGLEKQRHVSPQWGCGCSMMWSWCHGDREWALCAQEKAECIQHFLSFTE